MLFALTLAMQNSLDHEAMHKYNLTLDNVRTLNYPSNFSRASTFDARQEVECLANLHFLAYFHAIAFERKMSEKKIRAMMGFFF